MPYRAIITILIPAFFVYATLSLVNPAITYAANEPTTHFEPENIEPPANEAVQPEEKGISKWWYVLIAVVLAGGAAAAAGGGGAAAGGGGAPAGGGGGGAGGTLGVSW